MERQDIRKIALECGFKLGFQPDGDVDVDYRVYDFAAALLDHTIYWQEAHNLPRVIELSTAMSLIYNAELDTVNMYIVRALDILRNVRDELASPIRPYVCPIPDIRKVEPNLPLGATLHTHTGRRPSKSPKPLHQPPKWHRSY